MAVLLPDCRENSLARGGIGHIACCVSSLPTTSLLIADFSCNLPDFLAFLIGIGRMKIFRSFSAQKQLSFWTFIDAIAPYAQTLSQNADPSYFSVHFGAFEAYSAHMPKISSPPARLSFKASLFPGERLHS